MNSGGSSWVTPPSPCRFGGNAPYGVNWYGFFWTTPVVGVCAKTARYLIPSMTYRYLDFAYELRTPTPFNMSSGQYTGSLTYSIGHGQARSQQRSEGKGEGRTCKSRWSRIH